METHYTALTILFVVMHHIYGSMVFTLIKLSFQSYLSRASYHITTMLPWCQP